MIKITTLGCFGVIGLLLTACTTVSPPPVVRPAVPLPTEQAEQLAGQGRYLEAAERYQQLAQTASIAARAEYLLRAAANWLRASQPVPAEAAFAATDPQALPTALRPLHTLIGADLRLRAGDATQALQLSEQVPLESLPPELRALRFEVRARALEQQGQGRAAALERIARDPYLNPADRIENQATLLITLARLPQSQLQALQAPPPDSLGGWASLALRLRRQDAASVEVTVATWRREYPSLPLSQAALERALTQLRLTPLEPTVVALLLPLRGKFAAEAEVVRDGYMSGVLARRWPLVVQVYAYKNADDVEARYQEAVQAGATWVVGPLDKDAVTRLASLSRLLVPVLALNQVPGAVAENLYQFGLLPEAEVQALTRLAQGAGVRQAYILAPETPWGERLVAATLRAWPGETSVARYLGQTPSLSDAALAGRGVSGAAAFLLADAAQARSLLPTLRSANLPIYANAQVFEGVVDDRLEGVYMCDQSWLLTRNTDAAGLDLTTLHQDWPELGTERLRLFALGMDAAHLTAMNPATLGSSPETGLRANSGRLYQDAQRRIQREPACAQFTQGWPRRIDPPQRNLPVGGT